MNTKEKLIVHPIEINLGLMKWVFVLDNSQNSSFGGGGYIILKHPPNSSQLAQQKQRQSYNKLLA